jgi:hypothetical protein
MWILVVAVLAGVVALLAAASVALMRGAGSTRSAIGRGAVVVAVWIVATGAVAGAVSWATSDDDDATSASSATKTPSAADSRAELSGTLTLDGAPLEATALGVRVERDGYVAACQRAIPTVTAGRYEIAVLSDDEVPGCGADGASLLLWVYADGTVFALETAEWPGDGAAVEFDAAFSSSDPDGASAPVTAVYALVTDADGASPPVGTRVEAFVGATRCGISSIRRYGDESGFLLFASGPDQIAGCTEGATLSFVIGGMRANETIVHNFDAGEDGEALQLTVNETFERS